MCGCVTKHDLVGLVVGGGRDESLHERREHCVIWWTDLDAVLGSWGEIQVSRGHIWIGSSGLGSVHSVACGEMNKTSAGGTQSWYISVLISPLGRAWSYFCLCLHMFTQTLLICSAICSFKCISKLMGFLYFYHSMFNSHIWPQRSRQQLWR